MSDAPSTSAARNGLVAIIALVVVSVAAVAVWLTRESAWEAQVAEALAPYASASLPAPGSPVDSLLADLGAQIFRKRCAACHLIHGEDKVGPSLAGVTDRRAYAWIEGMILSPDSMTANDPTARELKGRFGTQMVTPAYFERAHALALVEFLRQVDAGAAPSGPSTP